MDLKRGAKRKKGAAAGTRSTKMGYKVDTCLAVVFIFFFIFLAVVSCIFTSIAYSKSCNCLKYI